MPEPVDIWKQISRVWERYTTGQFVQMQKPPAQYEQEILAWEKEQRLPGVLQWYSDRIDTAVDWLKTYESDPGPGEVKDLMHERAIRAGGYVLEWLRDNTGVKVVKPQPTTWIPKGMKSRIKKLQKEGYKKITKNGKVGLLNGVYPWWPVGR